jgi:hypothetical protein
LATEGTSSYATVIHLSLEVAERPDSRGEIAAKSIKAKRYIVYRNTEEHVLRVEELPTHGNEVYSPPLGGHNGNLGYYLAVLLVSRVLLET